MLTLFIYDKDMEIFVGAKDKSGSYEGAQQKLQPCNHYVYKPGLEIKRLERPAQHLAANAYSINKLIRERMNAATSFQNEKKFFKNLFSLPD